MKWILIFLENKNYKYECKSISRFPVLPVSKLTHEMVQTENLLSFLIASIWEKIYISFTQWTVYKLDIHRGIRSLTILSEVNFMLPKLDLELGYFGTAGWE